VPATLRPLVAPDSTAARALALAVLDDARDAEPMLASLDGALRSASDEYGAIVAHDGDALVGVVVFGETAGARGAGRLYLVAVDATARRRGIAMALTEAACTDLRTRGARFVVIEAPEEARLQPALALAWRAGFREEGRVGDYVRDGVGLVVLRRDLRDA
jgi:ribosomal protein S18 acetylase RimI-like enzyme